MLFFTEIIGKKKIIGISEHIKYLNQIEISNKKLRVDGNLQI